MEITTELVNHLAQLSRLEFSAEEIENFKAEFKQTLNQVDAINNADTSKVEEKGRMIDAQKELREDEIKQGLTVKEAIKNAPDSLGGSVLIPVEIV